MVIVNSPLFTVVGALGSEGFADDVAGVAEIMKHCEDDDFVFGQGTIAETFSEFVGDGAAAGAVGAADP